MQTDRQRLFAGVERLLFGLFLAALFWAPLPFGSNRPWALALLFVVLAALLVVWLALLLFDGVSVSRRVWARGLWPLLLVWLIPLWIFIQTLPMPGFVLGALSPRALQLHQITGWLPISLDVAHTKLYLLNSLACCCGFTLVLVLVTGATRAKLVLWTLVLSGVFQAAYGSLMVLSGLELGFLVEKYTGLGSATGTFVNRNHLAGYLVMCLAAGIGLLMAEFSNTSAENFRQFLRQVLRTFLSRKIILRIMLALMVIALVLTHSRMGNVAFFVSLALAGLVAIIYGRKFSPRLILLLLSLFVVDMVIVGQWFGFAQVVERLEQTASDQQARLDVSVSSSSILADFPLTGSGGGSYYGVFSYYQDVATYRSYYHAHNDYLEIASNLGIPVAAFGFGGLLLLTLKRALQLQAGDHSRLQRGLGFTLVMALTWLLIHSTVDFNMHIPANSLTLTTLLALAFAKTLPGKEDSHDIPVQGDKRRQLAA